MLEVIPASPDAENEAAARSLVKVGTGKEVVEIECKTNKNSSKAD